MALADSHWSAVFSVVAKPHEEDAGRQFFPLCPCAFVRDSSAFLLPAEEVAHTEARRHRADTKVSSFRRFTIANQFGGPRGSVQQPAIFNFCKVEFLLVLITERF